MAMYRLLLSNARWFANRNDGYGYRVHSGYIEVREGSMQQCSENYYRLAEDWANLHPSVRVADNGQPGTESILFVNDADLQAAVN